MAEMLEEHHERKKCSNSKRSFFAVNTEMLVAKSSFFFTYAVLGSVLSYLTVFLTSVGLTVSQAGYINGGRTIVAAICSPLWGLLADHTGRRVTVYLILAIGTVTVLFPVPWIAKYFSVEAYAIDPKNITTLNNSLFNYSILSNYTTIRPAQATTSSSLFSVMLGVFLLAAVFDFSLISCQDSLVIRVVEMAKQPSSFGPQRVFASIGFGVANLIAGVAADNYKSPRMSSYTGIFFVLLPAGLIMLPFGIVMNKMAKWDELYKGKEDTENKQKIQSVTSKESSKNHNNTLYLVLKTCGTVPNFVFFTTVFIMGAANTLVFAFTTIFIEKELHGSKSIMGLSFLVLPLSEIPIFLFSPHITRLLRGRWVCITIAVFSYFVRFLLISLIENPWLVLPIQAMNSVGFALFWVNAIEETYAMSPPEIKSTMIAILNSIHFSFSQFIISMICGVLYDKYGGRYLYRGSSFLFLFWTILLVTYFVLEKSFRQQEKVDNTVTGNEMKDIVVENKFKAENQEINDENVNFQL